MIMINIKHEDLVNHYHNGIIAGYYKSTLAGESLCQEMIDKGGYSYAGRIDIERFGVMCEEARIDREKKTISA